jgi:hypothetical protein
MLLPDSTGASGVGASLAGIVWEHDPRECPDCADPHHADLFLDAIIKGPSKWSVRPVAEFFVEKDNFGQFNTVSALVGLICQVRNNLSFDA